MAEGAAVVLRYVGDGSGLDNVPARDLTQADLDALIARGIITAEGDLIASGLYEEVNDGSRR